MDLVPRVCAFYSARSSRRSQVEPVETPCLDGLSGYNCDMGDTAIQSAIAAMSVDERLELVDYIEGTVDQSTLEVPDKQKELIRGRADDLAANPSIGLSWSELDARLGDGWR